MDAPSRDAASAHFNPSWEEMRIMAAAMQRGTLPDPLDTSGLSADPSFDRIDDRYRDRARYFHAFRGAFATLGVMADELRLPFEPLHPLPTADLREWLADTLRALGADDPVKDYKLSALSRSLVDSYAPGIDLLFMLDSVPRSEDLFLFDSSTGFAMWPDGVRTRNTWIGNQRDLAGAQLTPPPLRALLYRSESDLFSIGASLFLRVVEPRMRQRRQRGVDASGIPTLLVETQADLDAVAQDIRDVCARVVPLQLTAVFRGQATEHPLEDRTALARAGICPYAAVNDHSLVPSLYREYDVFQDQLTEFRAFIARLLDWSLWADLIFGNPATILTLDGRPYEPKPVPEGATASMAFAFSGESSGGRGTSDLGPYTKWTVTSADGVLLDEYIKVFRPGHDTVRRNLVLQHYGAKTPFLDVTRDIRVAEWFALNGIDVTDSGLSSSGRAKPPFRDPVIYVLFALEGLTPLIDTEELVTPSEALRPHRQACALIGGPGNLYRNSISRFIGLKIKFADSFLPVGLPSVDHLFPGPDEDNALKSLLKHYHPPTSGPVFPVYWFPTHA